MPPIRFGVCQLDLDARQLVRDGQRVHLSPKAFELLRILVSERPNAVSKETLHQRIWPDVFVTDDSLTRLVAEVRAAIGDPARGASFLLTFPKFGYAFSTTPAAPVPEDDGPGAMTRWLAIGARTVVLPAGDSTIGRHPLARVMLDDECVSRRHARLRVGSSVTVEDLGSRNGTSVNGERISGAVALHDGDEITIGTFTLQFRETADLETKELGKK